MKRTKTPKRREAIYRRQKRQRFRIREYLSEYKSARGCAHCGFNGHHAALTFHHVDNTKERTISSIMRWASLHREIEKCIVLCSNCHIVHHYIESGRDTEREKWRQESLEKEKKVE